MKYGETLFDILYLLLAVIGGIVIARRARSRAEKLMGLPSGTMELRWMHPAAIRMHPASAVTLRMMLFCMRVYLRR